MFNKVSKLKSQMQFKIKFADQRIWQNMLDNWSRRTTAQKEEEEDKAHNLKQQSVYILFLEFKEFKWMEV